MFKNYLKIALRHLSRNKSYTIINILGLAIGIACCLVILLFVKDELSYDQFHKKGDNIYRMALERKYPGRSTHYAIIPQSYAETIKKDIPQVEDATRLFYFQGTQLIQIEDVVYEEANRIWADSNFFDVFTFPLIQGDAKKALTQPNSVVLTESTAKRYFGDADPMGKVLDIPQNDNNWIVTGVCADAPKNSHFEFDLIASATSLNFIEQADFVSFSAYTYLLLNPNASPTQVETQLPDLVTKYASGQVLQNFGVSYEEYQQSGNGYRYFLQPLQDIYLTSKLEAELKPTGSKTRVYLFTIIAIFILVIACINFMNLATARSTERAREVGIRKTLGSGQVQIAGQFLLEAVAISFISTVLALGLLYYFIPLFNNLSGKGLSLTTLANPQSILSLVGFSLLVGLLAGVYPALVLSSFKPMQVLRGKLAATTKGALLRNGLVVFQFAISVILIISTIVVYRQLSFIQNKELGFDQEHIITLQSAFNLQDQTETFKKELLNLPGVAAVGGCSALPGGNFFGITFRPEGETETMTGRGLIVDNYYLDCMKMEMVEGRPFQEAFEDSLSVVLNETAVQELGLEDPIGKRLASRNAFNGNTGDEEDFFTVIGVVKDFHFQSLHQKITPLFFIHHDVFGGNNGFISVRMEASSLENTLPAIEQKWAQFLPGQPFNFTFLDQDLAQLYEAEQTAQKVYTLFSILAIFIACMGLLGLAAYVTQQRTKEIGIRKVLGATTENIVVLLSKDFLKLVALALVIASPIAWFAMREWLNGFAYSIKIQWWMFLLAGALAVLIAFLTVSFQSVRAALMNPVKSIRSE